MSDGRHRALAVSLAASILAAGAPCRASAADAEAKSRRLFAEADDLASHGQLTEACPLFKAAHELHATGGTALRTADCYEKLAKLDLALLHYQYIVEHGDTDKETARVALAAARVAALRKKLGLDEPALLPPVPVLPPPARPPPALVPNRVPAFIALGVGGAGAVVGGVFGGLALAQAADVKARCGGKPPCAPKTPDTTAGLQQQASAASAKAWVANVGIGLALVGVATGVTLYVLRWPRAPQAVKSALGPDGLALHF